MWKQNGIRCTWPDLFLRMKWDDWTVACMLMKDILYVFCTVRYTVGFRFKCQKAYLWIGRLYQFLYATMPVRTEGPRTPIKRWVPPLQTPLGSFLLHGGAGGCFATLNGLTVNHSFCLIIHQGVHADECTEPWKKYFSSTVRDRRLQCCGIFVTKILTLIENNLSCQ